MRNMLQIEKHSIKFAILITLSPQNTVYFVFDIFQFNFQSSVFNSIKFQYDHNYG
jgi:hypothetical protein